jgi:O-antigen/teichoic acid export membrane protein
MTGVSPTEVKPAAPRSGQLLQSGIILAAVSFLTSVGHYAFQIFMGRHLPRGEFGLMNSTLALVGLLGLPLLIGTYGVTHYIAHYRASGREAHLQGLLAGCRRFLLHLTMAVSVLAVIAVQPLSAFFHYHRPTLIIVALGCALTNVWSSFAAALCQGLAWFKRLALSGFLGMCLRFLFGWPATLSFPYAEAAVAASAVMVLANGVLLFWRKDLSFKGPAESPWNREFIGYLVVGAACVSGSYCFLNCDLLVAKRYFAEDQLGTYSAAERLAVALPTAVSPLLAVLFTNRSESRSGSPAAEQFKLLGLYALGLFAGLAGLLVLRGFLVKLIFGRPVPEAEAMVGRLGLTMVFIGFLQALGIWALASRWLRVSLLYGGLGLAYWTALLFLGRSPDQLLRVMPLAAATALGLLLIVWLTALRAAGARREA